MQQLDESAREEEKSHSVGLEVRSKVGVDM